MVSNSDLDMASQDGQILCPFESRRIIHSVRRSTGASCLKKHVVPLMFVIVCCGPYTFGEARGVLSFLRLRGGQRTDFGGGLGPSRQITADSAESTEAAYRSDSQDCPPESVERSIVIEASAEECFAAASNFEDYPKWSPAKTVSVRERSKDGLGTVVIFVMGIFGMTTTNTMAYKYDRPHKMNWHVTEGGIKELIGQYDFHQITPDRTRVVYHLKVEPGFPFPEVLKRATSRAVATAALHDLKRWTERQRALRLAQEEQVAGGEERVHSLEESTAAVRHLVPLC
mmetsp:Transcript_25569/g.51996  ORF Transcript_25569/g.51996 Transcript_25569/m.51996 type:complete len:285 (-) Transcript_25569:600-1454(-)